jgi:hypothetical protein
MNVNHLYLLFEKNMMKSLKLQTPLYFLFYFFEIPEIFLYKTPDLEYVNFATSCILFFLQTFITNYLRNIKKPGRRLR